MAYEQGDLPWIRSCTEHDDATAPPIMVTGQFGPHRQHINEKNDIVLQYNLVTQKWKSTDNLKWQTEQAYIPVTSGGA